MEPGELFAQIERNYEKALTIYREARKADVWDEIDALYRVYHGSFKMYRQFQKGIINYLNVIFKLAGERKEGMKYACAPLEYRINAEGIEKRLSKWEMDGFFLRTMTEALKARFTDNDKEVWHADQLKLTSGFFQAKTCARASMYCASRYVHQGRLPGDDGSLDQNEALFEHVWNFPSYRWKEKEQIRKEIVKARKKLKRN